MEAEEADEYMAADREWAWAYDEPAHRPEPNEEIARRAHALMLAGESVMEKYLRQQWEVATAAVRVAMDALRKLYPEEMPSLRGMGDPGDDAAHEVEFALNHIEQAFVHLDGASEPMLGELMHRATLGLASKEEVDIEERNMQAAGLIPKGVGYVEEESGEEA
jgi:hypothetical protein